MDEHDVDVVGQRVQRPRDGVLTGVAAGDHHRARARTVGVEETVLGEQRDDVVDTVLGSRDDDEVDRPRGRERAYGVDEHGDAAEDAQRLGGSRAEPLAASRGGDDHGRTTHRSAPARAGLAKTRRPLAVVRTLVTTTRHSLPTRSRACSVTTIVPSSR